MERVLDRQHERLSQLADRLRASGEMGRSEIINRLFEFLLAQSLADRSPKEFEIAQEVFGKDAEFDVAQDASVRVHIHRLRKKLDEVYAGTSGERLNIPRGEYRLEVQARQSEPDDVIVATDPIEIAPVSTPVRRRASRPMWWIASAILCAFAGGVTLGAIAWGWSRPAAPRDPRAETAFWQPLATSRRPAFVVTGDYYLFGEAPKAAQITRLVREFSINSREDLDEYLMTHPADYGRYVDLDLHYVPVSTTSALRELLPLVNDLSWTAQMGRPWVITMSRLAPEAFKGSNIVYVGLLSGLGLLRDPLFDASGFAIGASYDELIDRKSGKRFVSEWDEASTSRKPRRDFAYLASFPGPSGNRILVIAGTRDPAVMQAAEIATDKTQLDQISKQVGGTAGFEALYEVRTLGTLNLGSTLIVARPLKLDSLWRPGKTPQKFPDQLPLPASEKAAAANR